MTQETPSRSLDKIIVRLPDGMRDKLKSAAEENNRSVNAEVVQRLSISLGADALDDDILTDDDTLINVEGLSAPQRAQVEAFIRFLLSDKGK